METDKKKLLIIGLEKSAVMTKIKNDPQDGSFVLFSIE